MNIHWISSLRRLLPISSFSRSEKDENFDSEWKKDSSRPKGCIKIELNSNQKIIVAIDNFLSFFYMKILRKGVVRSERGRSPLLCQEDTLPGCHPCTVAFLAGAAGGPGEGGDCSNGEEERGLGA